MRYKEKINKWFVALKRRGPDVFDLSGLHAIEPPQDHYVADPFLIKRNGLNYLFYELYDYDKGRIAFSVINEDLSLTDAEVVLDESTHMSFPALFEENGEIYMTPETCMAGELRIYRAVDFPRKWEIFKVVAQSRFDDPILYKVGKEYYINATEGANALRILRANDLRGEWISTYRDDILHSRAAGQVFEHEGVLVRPTQNCLQRYGHSMVIKVVGTNQIIRTIAPDWFPELTGTHTFNFNKDYVVVDGRVRL